MLKERMLTAVILAPLTLAGFFSLPVDYFGLFIGAIIAGGAWEWHRSQG